MMMKSLVEKKLAFSYKSVAIDTSCETASMNQLVFALLTCLGEGINLQPAQDFKSDIERLEHKVNLVIFMLNNLVPPKQPRPLAQLLRLGTDSVAWQTEMAIDHVQPVELEIYLDPMISIPLRCIGRITEQEQDWYTARLTGLSEEEMSAWSKWVFRQHRQFVAHARDHERL